MPQTRSQQAAEEQVAEQPVDTVEQEQEARGSNIENTEVRSEEILAMLLEQKEIMRTQHFMQQKHIEGMNEWQRNREAEMDNIRHEFANQIKKLNSKFAQLENDVDRKIEVIQSELLEYCKAKEEQSLETYTSLLASALEDLKREMKEEVRNEICKQVDSKIIGVERSSTPRVGVRTKVKLPDYIDGEYSRVPGTRKSETQASLPKEETSTLRDVARPTQKPTAFDGKTSWDAYKTQFKIVAEINGWESQEKAAFLAASLQGQALSVLNCLSDSSRRNYNALVQALDSRYGTLCQSELNRATLRNRIRRRDESLPELAGDIERLVRLAYPSGTPEMLEALAKDQFVDAVHDDDIRLRIAQSRPTTLRQALEIALELESFVLANIRRSRYVREVRIDEPRYGSTSQVGPWNGVLDQLKALTQEMRNFTGEYVQQRGRGTRTPASPPKKCWTCRGDHLQRNCPDYVPERRNSRRNGNDDIWNSRSHSGERGQNHRGRSPENLGGRNNPFASDGRDQNTSNQGNGR